MRRPRLTWPWRWTVLLVSTFAVVAAVFVDRDPLPHEAAHGAAGGPATTSYAAPGPPSSPGTRGPRGPGRLRAPRESIGPTRPAPASRSLPARPGAPDDATTLIVGLGDSIPAGANCPGCTTYVDQVGHRFAAARNTGAISYNYAVSGYTTGDVLAQLRDAELRRRLGRADLVILTIGANDLETGPLTDPACADARVLTCSERDLATLHDELSRIEETVTGLLKPGSRLVVTGYWNVVTDGAVGRAEGPAWVRGSDTVTLRANQIIAEVTRDRGGTYVDVRPAFRGADGSRDVTGLLADDGDHLNAAGHALMADVVTAALR